MYFLSWKISILIIDFFRPRRSTSLISIIQVSKNFYAKGRLKRNSGRIEALCFTDTLRFLLLTFKKFEKVFRKTGNVRPLKMNKRSCKKIIVFEKNCKNYFIKIYEFFLHNLQCISNIKNTSKIVFDSAAMRRVYSASMSSLQDRLIRKKNTLQNVLILPEGFLYGKWTSEGYSRLFGSIHCHCLFDAIFGPGAP